MPYVTLDYSVDINRLHQCDTEQFPFFLDSAAINDKTGRYSMLFTKPQQILALEKQNNDFINSFDLLWKSSQKHDDTGIPKEIPFRGGWFVFFSYEFAECIEPNLSLKSPPYPIAYAGKCGSAIIVDHVHEKTFIVADLSANDDIQIIQSLIENNQTHSLQSYTNQATEDPGSQFLDGVDQCRQYIIDGDVFQVNLSRGWSFAMDKERLPDLYHQLREANPAPFAASCHFQLDDCSFSILSSSPERLISIKNKNIETRPIAGTRPRGIDDTTDKALSNELIGHFKERAEHVMLIDLERNDLGRICKAGSIAVNELMAIESYAHVHHIVSNVVGVIRDDITPADAIKAVFPGGTITGCPKVRCMEIIQELEQTYRGAYTGSLGYINHNGDMDTNILIRTFTWCNDVVKFRAGAGIVFDSIAKNELKETRNKARGMLKAIENKFT